MVYRGPDGAGGRAVLSAGHGEEGEEWGPIEFRSVELVKMKSKGKGRRVVEKRLVVGIFIGYRGKKGG